jgi:hypothetical protein
MGFTPKVVEFGQKNGWISKKEYQDETWVKKYLRKFQDSLFAH